MAEQLIHSPFFKAITIFGILFVVLFLASTQLQSSFTTAEINENQEEVQKNRDLQYEAREIQNDYRNKTLDLLSNLTERVSIIEQKIISILS